MKKTLMLLMLSSIVATTVLLNATETTVDIKQGWQLVGNGSSITTMDNFKKNSIKTIWRYDNSYKRWSAFSSDENILASINSNTSIANLHNIPQNSGFWVNANSDDTITIDETNNIEAYNLKKGWQLLGTNVQIDNVDNVFNGSQDIDVAWSYDTSTQRWSAYSPNVDLQTLINNNSTIDTIQVLNANKGFWVLANNDTNLITDQIKTDVESLQNTTKTATVSDAKNLFTQLREAANSLYNDENSQDQTTIIGQQSKLISDKVEPVVESIASDLDNTVIALEDSFTAFDTSIEGNFDSVLNILFNRMANLDAEMQIVENGNTTTVSFNGATIVSVDNAGEENDSVTTTGDIIISDTDYNITITKLNYNGTKMSMKANGTITGINNSSMTLTDMDISFDIDHTQTDSREFQNIEINYDGTTVSGGRTFRGQMTVSESDINNNKFIGTFTGLSGEPIFEGIIAAKVNLDDIKELEGYDDIWLWSNSLITLTDTVGKTEFLTKSYGDYNNGSINFETQSFNASCTTTASYISEVTKDNTSCANYVLNIYNTDMLYDKVVKIDIDNKTYPINSVWYQNIENGSSTYYHSMYISNFGEIDFNPQNSNYQANFNYSDFRIEELKSIDDFNADISFDGTITDGTKQMKLTLGAKTFESNNLEVVYGQNIEITDGDSFIKIDNLQLTKKKNIDEDIFGLMDLQGFAISIKDHDGNDMTIDANISVSNTLTEDNEIYFDGVYSYNGTTFTGKASGVENSLKDTQSFKLEGSIVANGFEPFGVQVVGASTNEADDIYGLFTRGSGLNEYKLGFFIDENSAKLFDSNGVKGIDYQTNLTIEDKDGNALATYGESSSGNTWEISYTDGTSETLF